MTQAEFVSQIAARVNENGKRKFVSQKKQVYHLRDDDGNGADFVYKPPDRTVQYNKKDIAAFLEAFVEIVGESMQRGEPVRITGLGVFTLSHHKARRSKQPGTDIWHECAERYVPKVHFSNAMRRRAILYEGPEINEEEPSDELELDGGEFDDDR